MAKKPKEKFHMFIERKNDFKEKKLSKEKKSFFITLQLRDIFILQPSMNAKKEYPKVKETLKLK